MSQFVLIQMTMNPPILRNRDRPRFLTHDDDERIALLRKPNCGAMPRTELR